MDRIAERYVRLVLAVGKHDTDYVDAYYGPPALKEAADAESLSLDGIADLALSTQAELRLIDPGHSEEILQLRHQYLTKQLESLLARVGMLQGRKMSFDEESRALYDAVAPTFPEQHFQAIVKELDSLLPGRGPVPQRHEEFKRAFTIPRQKLDSVFQAAVGEARLRTNRHIDLPPGESFTVEYVTGKSWSGYNWYKGESHSLIQVNTDLPIFIDRAVDLASHEGYPGHHVYNALLEQHMVNERKWIEFSVYALFSPQSLIAEGTANFGIDVAFPAAERLHFERDVLFPLAGFDGSAAEMYYRVYSLTQRLSYAGNEAARRYLNGEFAREAAAKWLVDYALMSPERAQQRTRFFDQYRSYVINYNLGQDLVRDYIESRGGTADRPEKRWEEFGRLISSPRLPSGLRQDPR